MTDVKRRDVLTLDQLRHRAVDAGKQAAFDRWQSDTQRVSAAVLAHEAATATAGVLMDEVRALREALAELCDEVSTLSRLIRPHGARDTYPAMQSDFDDIGGVVARVRTLLPEEATDA